jgi:CRP-like cAMP-binding protein
VTLESALGRFVSRLSSRSTLSTDERRAVLGLNGLVSEFRARVDIVVPGQHVDYACLIGQGVAARFDQMRNGQRQLTAFHIAGDMCDLHSVVAPTAAWGITSLTPTLVVQVPHVSLQRIIGKFPNLALAFWRDGTADASILAKWLGNLGRQDSRARLAHLLCELGLRMELAGIGRRMAFHLAVTQEQMADALGLTPVHINRTLQRLRAEGLITAQGQQIEILDWGRLTAAAEFDPAYLLLGEDTQAAKFGALDVRCDSIARASSP